MTFRLKRSSFTALGAFGLLLTEAGDIQCVTLEHAYGDGTGPWAPKMPPGTYPCKRYRSPHFGYDVFIITEVPGHDFIEMHRANWQKDLNGCVGLGTAVVGAMITESEKAFDAFMLAMVGVDSFSLIVE